MAQPNKLLILNIIINILTYLAEFNIVNYSQTNKNTHLINNLYGEGVVTRESES